MPTYSPLRASVDRIDMIHNNIAAEFKAYVEGQCAIGQAGQLANARWHRLATQQEVDFVLLTKKAPQVYGIRTGGRIRCPVVQANIVGKGWNGEFAWFSWRERWKRHEQEHFILKDAAFTFFWGRPSLDGIQEQLFRAEWPHPVDDEKVNAGQPHWQVDYPLASLENTVAGIHFGMSGWECPIRDTRPFAHWRRYVEADWNELEAWAKKTLEYALHEIESHFPKQF
jgi:hypothetical protein